MAKTKPPGDFHFDGFDIPESNYFKMPNVWTDITAQITSLAELKVVEYVLRHTWGFQEFGMAKRITTNEFMHGRKTKNGTRLDTGTGLSNRSVIDGLRRAVNHGLLTEEVDDSDKARVKKYYALRMRSPQEVEQFLDVKKLHTGMKNLHTSSETTSQRSEKNTKERNNNNNVVVDELKERGVSSKIAQELVREYPASYVMTKIELLDFLVETKNPLVSRNPAGYLRKAITEDYAPPKNFKTRAQREAEEQERLRASDDLETAKRAQMEQEQEFHNLVLKTYDIPDDLVTAWTRVLDNLKLDMPQGSFEKYFSDSWLLSVDEGLATVGVMNETTQKWLENRASSVIANNLSGVVNQKVEVEFRILELDEID